MFYTATASRVHKRIKQQPSKGRATYIAKTLFKCTLLCLHNHEPRDANYSLNSEKYEQAIGTKYREINLPAFIYFSQTVLFHSATLCIQTPREVARTL